MRLETIDPFITASIRRVADGRNRLTIDYPSDPECNNRIKAALADYREKNASADAPASSK